MPAIYDSLPPDALEKSAQLYASYADVVGRLQLPFLGLIVYTLGI